MYPLQINLHAAIGSNTDFATNQNKDTLIVQSEFVERSCTIGEVVCLTFPQYIFLHPLKW